MSLWFWVFSGGSIEEDPYHGASLVFGPGLDEKFLEVELLP